MPASKHDHETSMSGPRPPRVQARPVGPQRGTVRPAGSRQAPAPGQNGGGRSLRLGAILAIAGLAIVIVIAGLALMRPLISDWAVGFAQSNPQALRMGFVADLVAGALGNELTEPISDDTTPVPFEIPAGATASDVAADLAEAGLISKALVFEYAAITTGTADALQAGTYELNRAMSPQEILAALQDAPVLTISVGLREGLRLEQIAAYLQTIGLRPGAAKEFYDLAKEPSAALRADYPFLETLPKGRSLEGYLAAGTYEVMPFVTGEEIVRLQLDEFGRQLEGFDAVGAAKAEKRDFYDVLTLASIVEREAGVDAERSKIAGVYTNRLDPDHWATGLLDSDPTVFYGWDTVQLDDREFDAWPAYRFWTPPGTPLKEVELPDRLASYQTYQRPGLPDGPIATPTMASIKAALEPDTKNRYLFFVLKNDESRTHAFAKTFAEHEENLRKYGYQ
jgi:peptidoglycan lytic transglycosylase G